MKMFLKKESTDGAPSVAIAGVPRLWCLRIEQATAEHGEVLSTRVELSRFHLRKSKQKTRRQVAHESSDRDGVLRETGRLDEDSEQIQGLGMSARTCTAAAWRNVGCGRLPSAPTVLF